MDLDKVSTFDEAREQFPRVGAVRDALEKAEPVAKSPVHGMEEWEFCGESQDGNYTVGYAPDVRWIERNGQSPEERVLCFCSDTREGCVKLIALQEDPEIRLVQANCHKSSEMIEAKRKCKVEERRRLNGEESL